MSFVICLLVLTSNYGREPVEVLGRLISSDKETWIIDITTFIHKNPRFKDTFLVQAINSDNCRIINGKN